MVVDRPPERGQHPAGQDAFRVLAAFPWQRTPLVRVKIEVTHDEPVLLAAPDRSLWHGYEEIGERLDDVHLATYALEEIVVEKLPPFCKHSSGCRREAGTGRAPATITTSGASSGSARRRGSRRSSAA